MIYLSGIVEFIKNTLINWNDKTKLYSSVIEINGLFGINSFNVTSVDFSWNSCLFVADGECYFFGFCNETFEKILKLTVPDNCKIVQGCCNNNRCHLVTESGGYWHYNVRTGEWKNIRQLLCTEKVDCSQQDDQSLFVNKVSCENHLTIAITNAGVYSVPSLLSFPKVKILNVSSGKEHTIILTEHGSVFTWGNGSRGQLGHGELEPEVNPRELEALSGLKVVAVSGGGWHSSCITEHGDLYTWGWNSHGQLGFPGEDQIASEGKDKCVLSVLAEPRPVDWPDDRSCVKQVSCGSRHTIVMLEDNTVWGCGWNKYGQLHKDELPEKVFGMSKINLPVEISKNIINIVCREWNSAFITR